MFFNFALVPIGNVAPWGKPGEHNLHWFGLTDGEYWIEAGDSVLLEYSVALSSDLGAPRYCSYAVARLYEDVMSMAPRVLEPVPANLVPYISGERARAWRAGYDERMARYEDELDDERIFALVDDASTWLADRSLDTGYLSPAANIWMWSDEAVVHVEWDNRERLHNGVAAWSARAGAYQLPRAAFVGELRAFHEALMTQMGQRVQDVLSGGLPSAVAIDKPGLEAEHVRRQRTIEKALAAPAPTDWPAVATAISEIERGGARPQA